MKVKFVKIHVKNGFAAPEIVNPKGDAYNMSSDWIEIPDEEVKEFKEYMELLGYTMLRYHDIAKTFYKTFIDHKKAKSNEKKSEKDIEPYHFNLDYRY